MEGESKIQEERQRAGLEISVGEGRFQKVPLQKEDD
jgi:hypothetical protein